MKKQIVFLTILALITACQPPSATTTPSEPIPTTYTVTAKAITEGGQISPSSLTVLHGESATFLVTASTGYVLSGIEGCPGILEGDQYTIASVTSACELNISFSPAILSFKTVLVEENIWEYRTSETMPDYVYAEKQFEGGLVSFLVIGQIVADLWEDGFPDVLVPIVKGYASGIDNRFPPVLFKNDGYRFHESTNELVGGMPAIPGLGRTVAFSDLGDGFKGIFGVQIDTFVGKGNAADAILLAAGVVPENVTDQLPRLPLADMFGRANAVDAHAMTAGDLNGDGRTDFIVGEWRYPNGPYKLIQYERGQWQVVEDPFLVYLCFDQPLENPEVGGGNALLDLHLADVDGDSFDDLIVGWGHGSSKSYVYLNDRQGGFSNDNRKALPVSIYGVDNNLHMKTYSFDADGDDDLDLLIIHSRLEPYYGGYTLQLLLNDGTGDFQDHTTPGIQNLEGRDRSIGERQEWSYNFYLIDVDRNSLVDIIGSDQEGIRLWLNEGGAVFKEVPVHTYVEHRGAEHIFVEMRNGEISSLVFRQSWTDDGTETRIFFDQSKLVMEMLPPPPTLSPQSFDAGYVIYDDALTENWWAGTWEGGEVADNSTTEVYAGTQAIQIFAPTNSGTNIGTPNPPDPSQYTWLVFHVNIGQTNEPYFTLNMWHEGEPILGKPLDIARYVEGGNLEPGQWYQVVVPLSDLLPDGEKFDQINFEHDGSSGATTFYLDEIRLVAAGP